MAALVLTSPLVVLAADRGGNLAGEKIEAFLGRQCFAAASWGVMVVRADSGEEIFAHAPDRLLHPASNAKLFTAALALDRLGPDYRIRTSLCGRSFPGRDGFLDGDLVIYGRGDFSMAKRFHGDGTDSLGRLMGAIWAAGIREVGGDLVADGGYFRGAPYGTEWAWEDLGFGYGAAASAFVVDDNAVELEVLPGRYPGMPVTLRFSAEIPGMQVSNQVVTAPAGTGALIRLSRLPGDRMLSISGRMPVGGERYTEKLAVWDPAGWMLKRLKRGCEARGIRIRGGIHKIEAGRADADIHPGSEWKELGFCESPPVRELVVPMLKDSVNLYAQLLLMQVGARSGEEGAARWTSEERGLHAMKAWAAETELPSDALQLEDGAGLSQTSLVSARSIVRLLDAMQRHPWGPIIREALPVAGVDGTLEKRFRSTILEGRLRAKTGHLRNAECLSGYLIPDETGPEVLFAVMLNHFRPPPKAPSPREAIDRLMVMIAEALPAGTQE